MNHIYNIKELAESYLTISTDQLVFINTFGEPFFKGKDSLYKVSMETGDTEIVDSQIEDDYWTADSLREKWEEINGEVGANHFLVPIIPFTLGGEFKVENLMRLEIKKALEFYEVIRDKISELPDGSKVRIVIKD